MYAKQAREVDIIITTALIPGKPAPKLITAEMVQSMKPGQRHRRHGGRAGRQLRAAPSRARSVVKHGVTIIGYTDLASRLATQASTLYSNNLLRLTEELCKTKETAMPSRQHGGRRDPRLDGHQGRRHHLACAAAEAVRRAAAPPRSRGRRCRPSPRATASRAARCPARRPRCCSASARSCSCSIGRYAPPSFLGHFTVFVLACFVGYMVVWNVKPALHTPLMSVTNAVSQHHRHRRAGADRARPHEDLDRPVAAATSGYAGCRSARIALATINMFGGFAVTQRMLQMFRK